MEGNVLENPPNDAISRIRFASRSNDLLLSSWDSTLRLYDADSCVLRLKFDSNAVLLDCCFENDSIALSVGSDCHLRRYDFYSGSQVTVGNHDDLACCVEYSEETSQAITAGLDKKIMLWDMRTRNGNVEYSKVVGEDVQSMSLCGLYVIAAVGVNVNMYDLRNFSGPVQSKESPLMYRIRCMRSFPNRQVPESLEQVTVSEEATISAFSVEIEGYAVGSIEGRVALELLDRSDTHEMRYAFRCHPKSKDGRYHLVTVNDIDFNPCYGTFITGDNEGYVIIWDGRSRKRLFEFPKCPSSVASLSYNNSGQLLAVASSYTYQEADEVELTPQVFIQKVDEHLVRPFSSGSSK